MAAIMAATYPDLYTSVGVHSGLPWGAAHDLHSAFTVMKHCARHWKRARTDGRSYPCTIYHDRDGQAIVEKWMVHQAGHAWAGGGSNGSYTDARGPDASGEMVRFFAEHPKQR